MDKKKWKYFMDEVNPSIQISMSAVILNTLNKLKQFVMVRFFIFIYKYSILNINYTNI